MLYVKAPSFSCFSATKILQLEQQSISRANVSFASSPFTFPPYFSLPASLAKILFLRGYKHDDLKDAGKSWGSRKLPMIHQIDTMISNLKLSTVLMKKGFEMLLLISFPKRRKWGSFSATHVAQKKASGLKLVFVNGYQSPATLSRRESFL